MTASATELHRQNTVDGDIYGDEVGAEVEEEVVVNKRPKRRHGEMQRCILASL